MAKKKRKSKKAAAKKKSQRRANPQYQDSLFRALFSDKEKAIGGKGAARINEK